MRPQTTIALLAGILIGIMGTWWTHKSHTHPIQSAAPTIVERPGSSLPKTGIAGTDSNREIGADGELATIGPKNLRSNPPRRGMGDIEKLFDSTDSETSLATQTSKISYLGDKPRETHNDGSYSIYLRQGDIVYRVDFFSNRDSKLRIVYKLNEQGRIESYDAFDSENVHRFTAIIRYSKREGPTFGKIVQELLYGINDKIFADLPDENGEPKELPAYMFVYLHDFDGSMQAPVGTSLTDNVDFRTFILHGEEVTPFGRIAPHIVSALNKSYPIEPLIKP